MASLIKSRSIDTPLALLTNGCLKHKRRQFIWTAPVPKRCLAHCRHSVTFAESGNLIFPFMFWKTPVKSHSLYNPDQRNVQARLQSLLHLSLPNSEILSRVVLPPRGSFINALGACSCRAWRTPTAHEGQQGHQQCFEAWDSPAQQRTAARSAHLSKLLEYIYSSVNSTGRIVFKR